MEGANNPEGAQIFPRFAKSFQARDLRKIKKGF